MYMYLKNIFSLLASKVSNFKCSVALMTAARISPSTVALGLTDWRHDTSANLIMSSPMNRTIMICPPIRGLWSAKDWPANRVLTTGNAATCTSLYNLPFLGFIMVVLSCTRMHYLPLLCCIVYALSCTRAVQPSPARLYYGCAVFCTMFYNIPML